MVFGFQKKIEEKRAMAAFQKEQQSKVLKKEEQKSGLFRGRKILAAKRRARQERLAKTGFALGQRAAQFRPPVEDFNFQEEVLMGMFGHGDHVWGTNMTPVEINNDLNPRQRGDTGTAELFVF